MMVTCCACGIKLDERKAMIKIHNGQRQYFCTNPECLNGKNLSEQEKDIHVKCYNTICEILGEKQIIHTELNKQWSMWEQFCGDEMLYEFLINNKAELIRIMSTARIQNLRLGNRIAYFAKCVSNKIGDYIRSKHTNDMYDKNVHIDTSMKIMHDSQYPEREKKRCLDDIDV